MPVHQTVDAELRRIVATISGEVEISDILGAITAAVNDPAFQPGFDVYSDHTQITRFITPNQLAAMVAHLESLSDRLSGARWAIVTSAPASFGMMRMLEVHAERIPMEVRVFRSAGEAEHWLAGPRV
jgi:hypothetical protein